MPKRIAAAAFGAFLIAQAPLAIASEPFVFDKSHANIAFIAPVRHKLHTAHAQQCRKRLGDPRNVVSAVGTEHAGSNGHEAQRQKDPMHPEY